MSLANLAQQKTNELKGLAGLASKPIKADTFTVEGLGQLAQESGLGEQAARIIDTKPKLPFLQRLGKGLGAFNPAEAILTGKEGGVGSGVLEYGKNIAQGIGSAITGKDFEGERRTFKDVAEEMGIENRIAKFGIGLAGDVLLDPTTYFGGAIAKGLGIAAKGASKISLKSIGKVAPEVKTGLELVGTGLQDALGRAFKYGYGASKGAKEDVLSFLSKEQRAKLGLAASNIDRLGTGILTPSQREELAVKMIAGKRAEFVAREAGKSIDEAGQIARQTTLEGTSPEVAKAIEAQMTRSQKIGQGLTENPYEVYFPFIKKGKLAKFVNETKGIKVGSEGYRKQFKNLLTNENMELDPAKAFFTRESQIVADRMTRDFLSGFAKKYGQKFANEAEAKATGYVPVYEKGLSQGLGFYKGEIDVAEDILKQMNLQKMGTTLPNTGRTWEQQFIKVGQAIKFAEESGLKVSKGSGRSMGKALGRATLGGSEKGGIVKLKSFSSEVISHELGHSFDIELSKVINTKKIYQKELANLVEKTGLGGGVAYRRSAVERFAEFVMTYVHDPSKAKEWAPEFTKFFENNYLKNQKISELVNKIGSFFQKVDGLPNITTPLKEMDNASYFELAIKKAFPKKEFIGVKKNEALGYISEWDAKLLRDSISPEFQTINMLAKATGFDAITSLFKRSVTGLFAPFHVRNFLSGQIQNFEVLGAGALNPKNINVGRKIAYLMGKGEKIPAGTIEIGGKPMKFSDVIKPFTDRFSGDTFYNADFEMALKSGTELKQVAGIFSKQRIKETAKTVGLGQEAIPFKVGRGIGQFIEHQQKATAYVTALSQGKNIDEALRIAEAAGFDYRALTKFESQIMRRLIPFYSFTRKNVELQIKTLGENPQRINQVLAFFRNVGEPLSEEEKQNLPDFIKESIGVKLQDTPEGLKQYISSFGTPVEAFTQLFGSNPILRIISTMNPAIKVPIELGIGKDSFRQRDLKDVYTANEYKLAPQVVKDLLGIREVSKPIYRTINGKAVKTGERVAYIADPEKLLIARSLFTSRGVSYLDQLFGNDLKGFVKFLKTTTGVKPQQVDIESQKYFNQRDKQRALEDLLTRYGVTKQFTKTYIPKN
ncbi:hypothetical protein C4544_05250 [candidate division WS5 bacterium]|uniref:Large polyvalent protein associated domain-containing protein n=1 Tax=candidate division WS5 bacterium TaxID=2093353 RepID=A0A419DBE3_9BACT|nr:MAG: hypothetical protein C4544_05250 [candidate division WS5 bacterium]